MLSRVADSLYWMSRYLERAEHTARLLDVQLNLMLERSPDVSGERWAHLLRSLNIKKAVDAAALNDIPRALALDPANPASVVACITTARENARQVREQISSEMWEQLNELYLYVLRARTDERWQAEPHPFFRAVKQGAHLFQGITDSTMNHGEGWLFIQLSRFLERMNATAVLLDAHFAAFPGAANRNIPATEYLEWLGLLKSCSAFEAYCKVYTVDLRPDRIAEFLLLNADFPRSVRFAAETVQSCLSSIADFTQTSKSGRANRLAGRLRAALSFDQIDEIIGGNLHDYLDDVQRQSSQIHSAIYQLYVTYPIESAIAS
jgi:uncharacterized alpha-E superfamily protein